MEMTIRAMTEEERAFSYTQETEILEKAGCIGHLRGDMGTDGNSFYTTWDDHVPGLKKDAFKQEFDNVINLLRFDERYGGLFRNREDLNAYCRSNPDSAFRGNYTQEYGFRADTEAYSYMIRCNPHKGDYNFYVYAYEREMLDKALQPEQEKITVLVVEPGKKPYEKQIEPSLSSLQKEVGGYIQAVYPYEEPVAIICDEEGKLKGSKLNRALCDEKGQIYDILAGTFLVIGLSEDDFASLEDTHIKQFSEVFKTPEMFARINGKLVALPVEEEREPKSSFAAQLHEAEGKANAGKSTKETISKDEVER